MFELIMCDPCGLFGGTEHGDAIECNHSIIIIFFLFLRRFFSSFFCLCTPCHKYLISFVVCFFWGVCISHQNNARKLFTTGANPPLFIFILRLFGPRPLLNPTRWLKETAGTRRSCEGRRKNSSCRGVLGSWLM